jgi:hypothetical protein
MLVAGSPALEAIWAGLAPHVSGAYATFLSSATGEDVAAICPPHIYQRLVRACLAMGVRSGVLTAQDAAQKYQPWSSKQGWVCVPPACTPFRQYSQIPLVE